MRIVILGLSLSSSWGNGHATTYRALVRALDAAGHDVLFLERDMPWYAANRDLPTPPYGRLVLYSDLDALRREHARSVADADLVIVGSYVPSGMAVIDWTLQQARGPVFFYDIDTPVTLAGLEGGACEYLGVRQVPRFDAYLSFTGGPVLQRLEERFGAKKAWPLYCSVDPERYQPDPDATHDLALGYLGTYSADRQPPLTQLLLRPAEARPDLAFAVAGPQYPEDIVWPKNVERQEHLPPDRHPAFYHRQRFTLNVTRRDMVRTGYAPSVRLFEAAACGTPIISDEWAGLDTFFRLGTEILTARTPEDVLAHLDMDDDARVQIAARARRRVLEAHTATHRAQTLVEYAKRADGGRVKAHV